jgi:hypothetical protein
LAFDLPLALSPIRTRRRVSPLDAAFSLVADQILGDARIARPLTHSSFLLAFGGWFVAQTGRRTAAPNSRARHWIVTGKVPAGAILIDAQFMFSIILPACLWAFNRTAAWINAASRTRLPLPHRSRRRCPPTGTSSAMPMFGPCCRSSRARGPRTFACARKG